MVLWGFVLRFVYGWSVGRGACGIKHRGGLMSGVCDLDAVTVEIYPEEILPLTLGSFEMILFAAANICHSYWH